MIKKLSKSQIKFKAGSFKSISKTIDSKKTIKLAEDCTRIKLEEKEKSNARTN